MVPENQSTRPDRATRQESNMLPHLRRSVVAVPVTPDMSRRNSSYFGLPRHKADPTLGTDADETASSGLSGRIISATFSMPHKIRYRKGPQWDLKPRHDQCALFDSLAYLSSDQVPYDHTVVAWTGEIEEIPADIPSPPSTPPAAVVPVLIPAPAPGSPSSSYSLSSPGSMHRRSISGDLRRPSITPRVDDLWISREDMDRLEEKLAAGSHGRIIPVWDDGVEEEEECGEKEEAAGKGRGGDGSSSGGGVLLKNQERWRCYAEHELYSLFHYKQPVLTDGKRERFEWADFHRMNEAYADRIAAEHRSGDLVIVHDYHLILLPALLRERIPDVHVCFVLHSPFPSSELVKCLPRRDDVLRGMLGADLVGFQTRGYACHFASCCTRILGCESENDGVILGGSGGGRRVCLGVFPMGIDSAKVGSLAFPPEVTEKYDKLKEVYRDQKIIVGRDRLDVVHGVTHKLAAFERFLDTYPEWRGKVVLIQVTSPPTVKETRGGDRDRDGIAQRVGEMVSRINGKYGNLDYTPVHHYPRYLCQDEYFALLRAGDVALVTSTRNGMSSASLEYVICQRQNHGRLLLSEFSGTVDLLTTAVHINPWDAAEVAGQIDAALRCTDDDEKGAMHRDLYDAVTSHTMQSWVGQILGRFVEVAGVEDKEGAEDRFRGRCVGGCAKASCL